MMRCRPRPRPTDRYKGTEPNTNTGHIASLCGRSWSSSIAQSWHMQITLSDRQLRATRTLVIRVLLPESLCCFLLAVLCSRNFRPVYTCCFMRFHAGNGCRRRGWDMDMLQPCYFATSDTRRTKYPPPESRQGRATFSFDAGWTLRIVFGTAKMCIFRAIGIE
jgi:hypothetical protein